MKILLIHPFLQLGGGEQVIVRLANFFVQKGHTVGIACAFADTRFLGRIDKRVTLFVPSKTVATLSQSHRIFLALLGMPALLLLSIGLSFSFDVLFPHNFPAIFFAAVAKLFSNKKIVWEFNEGAPMPKMLYFLEEWVGKMADKVIVLDEKNKKKVRKRFGKVAHILRPGVDFGYWSVGGKGERGKEKGQVILLSVGKLHPQKNQIMLVDVAQKLLPKIPTVQVVLVGNGPDKERILKRVKDLHMQKQVTLAGVVSNEALRMLYKNAFLVCFPARDQTWGLTPFEALCQKTVSIVSDEAGAAEVLKPAKLALIAAPTGEDFTNTILKAYKNPSALKNMGERGKEFVRKNLTWEKFGEEAEKLCRGERGKR